jgi:hypothetical protein
MSVAAYDPLRALRVLLDHAVDFVVIGGFAARLWGSPTVTNDLDVCAAWDPVNLERLSAALVELDARLRGAPADVPFVVDARSLANGLNFTFATTAGGLDVLAAPAGGFDYPTLREAARAVDLGAVTVDVVDLDDLIAMKRAAARPKDRIEVEVLEAVRDERRRRPSAD